MSEVKGFVVTLARDIGEEHAETIVKSIGLIRGVINVAPVNEDPDDYIIRTRVDGEWRDRLYDMIRKAPR